MTIPIDLLRNPGTKSSQWHRDTGISTIEELQQLGPVAAFHLVKDHHPKVTWNLLWALEAGLKGQDCNEQLFSRHDWAGTSPARHR